jgi:hypothetical protein
MLWKRRVIFRIVIPGGCRKPPGYGSGLTFYGLTRPFLEEIQTSVRLISGSGEPSADKVEGSGWAGASGAGHEWWTDTITVALPIVLTGAAYVGKKSIDVLVDILKAVLLKRLGETHDNVGVHHVMIYDHLNEPLIDLCIDEPGNVRKRLFKNGHLEGIPPFIADVRTSSWIQFKRRLNKLLRKQG